MPESIEDLILQQDKRGVGELRPHLPVDYCTRAAQYVLDHPGDVSITTGFYILAAGSPETDGPPGAIAIGRALETLGRRVSYIIDTYTAPVLWGLLGPKAQIEDFPIVDVEASRGWASDLLARINPSLLISIERCGRTAGDAYLNMRAVDITPFTARLDYLFDMGIPSVGIGDGGNEIGMGNLADVIPTVPSLPTDPAVVKVDRLVIASVSNWGGYGLVAALSRLTGRNLLPSVEQETALIHRTVELGAVDGANGLAVPTVDDFTTEENSAVLEQLHRAVGEAVT